MKQKESRNLSTDNNFSTTETQLKGTNLLPVFLFGRYSREILKEKRSKKVTMTWGHAGMSSLFTLHS